MTIQNAQGARYAALAIRKRLEDVARTAAENPNLVRLATGDGGDTIAFWYSGPGEQSYNVSAAQKEFAAILKAYPNALKSRSGHVLELPMIVR